VDGSSIPLVLIVTEKHMNGVDKKEGVFHNKINQVRISAKEENLRPKTKKQHLNL
jgi:hypothetical protein